MKKLYKGIHRFQESYFKKEEEFFKRLSNEQEPEVLGRKDFIHDRVFG